MPRDSQILPRNLSATGCIVRTVAADLRIHVLNMQTKSVRDLIVSRCRCAQRRARCLLLMLWTAPPNRGALTAPTSLELTCRWRRRPKHQQQAFGLHQRPSCHFDSGQSYTDLARQMGAHLLIRVTGAEGWGFVNLHRHRPRKTKGWEPGSKFSGERHHANFGANYAKVSSL